MEIANKGQESQGKTGGCFSLRDKLGNVIVQKFGFKNGQITQDEDLQFHPRPEIRKHMEAKGMWLNNGRIDEFVADKLK